MFTAESQSFFSEQMLIKNIPRLIFGRLALIFLLLLASWWWSNNFLQTPFIAFPNSLFLLFAISVVLTIFYLLVFRFNDKYIWQVRAQFYIDVVLISWIVWETGDVVSPYVTLYVVLITIVGFFLDRIGTVLLALSCSICFTTLAILSAKSIIYSFSGDISTSKIAQNLAFNNISILVVGLLSAYISERRRVTEQLRETEESFEDLHVLHERILASIRSGLITTDLAGVIHSFNRAAQEISGFRIKNVLGKSIFDIFGDEVRPAIFSCINNAHEGNSFPTIHFETVLGKNSSDENSARKITAACSVSPLIGKYGVIYGLILTFQDITEIRAMEESIRKTDRLAAVGRMAAGLAHEIRNPLGSMSSALQYLQEKVPAETPEGDLMEVVLRESERLNTIITNFLAYARPSANVFLKEKFELTDVNAALQDCLTLLQHSPEINESHIFESELPDEVVMIKANETQLKQVFWNIMRNSIQAMPAGGKLKIKLSEKSEQNVQIIFEDTGCGISQKNLEHLFEPFSSGGGGTGLGLSIVRKIVQDHHGHINVQSSEDVGTKITIELPR